MDHWEVSRNGSTLCVAMEPEALAFADEIVEAVERSADDTVDLVCLTGRILDEPRRGLTALLRRVGDVATEHGKRFHVGPI